MKNQAVISNIALNKLIFLMPGHVYWKDNNGVFLGCNLQQARSFGFESPEELIGKTDYDVLTEEQAKVITEIDRQVIESGEPVTMEEFSRNEEGEDAYYLSHKVPILDDAGVVIGVLGISFDITEQKKLAAELEVAGKIKREIKENLAHILKTPLNGITGSFQCIQMMSQGNKDIAEMTAMGLESSELMLSVVNRMLDFAKVDADSISVHYGKYNLRELIEPMILDFTSTVQLKGIDLNLSYPADAIEYVITDAERIMSIARHLIDNAVKFTNDGSVSVIIKITPQENNEASLTIEVQDTGIGIPKDKQEVIFDKYIRLEPAYKGLHEGEGLGLAIVKKFVADLDGEIKLLSNVNEMTIFSVKIPIRLPKDGNMHGSGTAVLIDDIKVLVIDNNMGGEILARYVGSSNVESVTVNHAVDMLVENKLSHYDVVLINEMAGAYDFMTLCKILKRTAKLQESMFLALTKPIDADTVSEWQKIGIYDYVLKPYTAPDLVNRINTLWSQFKSKTNV